MQSTENRARAIEPSWRERANSELEKIVELFSSTQLPDLCAKALINAPGKPCVKWSFGNQILTFVAGTTDARGYKQWMQVGRHVKAGAKAFRILGPVFVKKRIESPSLNQKDGEQDTEILVGYPG